MSSKRRADEEKEPSKFDLLPDGAEFRFVTKRGASVTAYKLQQGMFTLKPYQVGITIYQSKFLENLHLIIDEGIMKI